MFEKLKNMVAEWIDGPPSKNDQDPNAYVDYEILDHSGMCVDAFSMPQNHSAQALHKRIEEVIRDDTAIKFGSMSFTPKENGAIECWINCECNGPCDCLGNWYEVKSISPNDPQYHLDFNNPPVGKIKASFSRVGPIDSEDENDYHLTYDEDDDPYADGGWCANNWHCIRCGGKLLPIAKDDKDWGDYWKTMRKDGTQYFLCENKKCCHSGAPLVLHHPSNMGTGPAGESYSISWIR